MDAATKQRLAERAAEVGAPLDEGQLERLGRYLALLRQWNARINLTTVIEEAQVIERHFVDSLAIVPLLGRARTLIDVGSGAGFPGAVLAVARPALAVTLVESIRKKVAFLQTLRREVGGNLEPVCGRVEVFRQTGRRFDVAVSRATWDPAEWLVQGAPLVDHAGLLIAMQGAEQPSLAAPPEFTLAQVVDYAVEGAARRLVAFRRA